MWKKPFTYFAIFLAAIFSLLVLAVATPHIIDATSRIHTALTRPITTTGLIFVESPEVYTRQRLVNDRYGQDAWLRSKLTEIDDEGTTFVDRRLVQQQFLAAGIGVSADPAAAADAGTAPAPTALPPIPDSDEISFRTKFDLQSAARDEIRQRILENALDDRHDLSGNTVFGLKFDTAVLPGSNTTLSPAVIVKMTSNPLDSLKRTPEQLVPLYGRWSSPVHLDSPDDPAGNDVEVVQTLDRHFDKWRSSIEQRLNDHKNTAREEFCGENKPALSIADRPLCISTQLSPTARSVLANVFSETKAVDEALSYVMRLPSEKISVGDDFLKRVYANAARECTTPDNQITVDEFLRENQATRNPFQLPLPWAQLFQLRLRYLQAPEEKFCKVAINLTLDGLEVPLAFVSNTPNRAEPSNKTGPDDPSQAGWLQVDCGASACAEMQKSVWVESRSQSLAAATKEAVDGVLTTPALDALLSEVSDSQLCFGRLSETDPWFYFGSAPPASQDYSSSCFAGESIQFRLGAYYFLRRMTEVESYTYAAFPRGDVTGVVTETLSSNSASAALNGLPGFSGRLAVGDASGTRATEAKPSMVNFASGRGPHTDKRELEKLFDFGWAIVKEGRKNPMMASQLVIVSVPAYLDSLELEVWQGFLDIDKAPTDRTQYNDLLLEQRVPFLMPSFEKRKFRLNIPPDYSALDGLVIGSNLVNGPRINDNALRKIYRLPSCSDLSIVIPGERLWRSTVVTLDDIKADKIEVMPDMLGILATFDAQTVQGILPPQTEGAADPGKDEFGQIDASAAPTVLPDPRRLVDRRLAVWTSEGNDYEDLRFEFHNEDCRLDGPSESE